ncbi:hypothetical protein AABB24_012593 [Solanum stoloniferum]|uniref:Uncharacterized protein n=1 Tax=Solanum stoloniferum TaxID=62892 RepID=A0ABD2U4S3_9SOLN
MASLRREPEEREADLLSSSPSPPLLSAFSSSLSSSPSPRLFFFSGQQQSEQCSDQRQQRLARCMTAVATAPSSQAKPSTPQNQQPTGTRGGNTSAFLFSSPSPLSLCSSDYDISNNSGPTVASEVEFIKDRSLQICPNMEIERRS